MARYALCADLQFDEYARLSTMDKSGLPTRLLDLIACWRWIVEASVNMGCKSLFILGDVFNSRTEVSLSVLDLVCREFHAASKKISLHVIAGNHDSLLRVPDRNSLQVFRGYATIYEEPTRRDTFALVPWIEDLDEYQQAVDTVSRRTGVLFLLSHILLEEAGYHGKGVPLSHLFPKRFKQILLGDVHEPKIITPHVRYVGSPLQIDFRDAGQTRGFCILDAQAQKVTFVENTMSPRFHMLSSGDVEGIRKKDFVRVKTENPKDAIAAVKAAQKITPWVEATLVEVEDTTPRIEVHTKDTHDEVLTRYCEYLGREDAEDLVKLGLAILKEAGD
ncbi:hypothetical protein LCGC14_1828830 [marine sediment metagenome]|uniref:Calcineurin-like phosphoesterase domain-containing protein n=1 Tax=marine sediment metagenome TaxID=412755 RepID=A0A0F9IW87_9ZZZZ